MRRAPLALVIGSPSVGIASARPVAPRSLSTTPLRAVIALFLLLLALMPSPASAGVIMVPEDVPTISQALLMVAPGDTISVAPGIYTGNLVWPLTPSVKLLSRVPRAAAIEAGPTLTSVITISGGLIDPTTEIAGFEIRYGSSLFGGGIYCNGSSPTIRNNYIHDNNAGKFGGGICCAYGSAARIIENRIEGNYADAGGGIYWGTGNDPIVLADTLISNSAGAGGGIRLGGGGVVRLCEILDNTAGGAGIWHTGTAAIEECHIALNHGRGIECLAEGVIRRCDIRQNSQGGIWVRSGSTVVIEENVIENHNAGNGAGILTESSYPIIRGNKIRYNDSGGGLAGAIFVEHGGPLIEHNEMTHNKTWYEASAMYCCDDSSVIRNNVISENTCGIPGIVGSGLFI